MTEGKVITNTPPQNEGKFPHNVVLLPSRGLFYPENHPLRNGVVELKFMTAKEENILTTESYIKQNVVIDKFLQSMIISPKFNYDDLLVGDKDMLFIASRIYGYGEIYTATVTTPSGRQQKVEINLEDIKAKEIDYSVFANDQNSLMYQYENQFGKYTLEFKLLTVGDLKRIKQRLDKSPVNGLREEVTARFEQMILSVNGNSDPNFIKLFINNDFLAKDSRKFRDYLTSIQPGPDTNIDIIDEETGLPFRTTITFGPDFLWPDA